jgi:hypothetical protein
VRPSCARALPRATHSSPGIAVATSEPSQYDKIDLLVFVHRCDEARSVRCIVLVGENILHVEFTHFDGDVETFSGEIDRRGLGQPFRAS